MFDVNLYVETTHQNYPKKRKRHYLYILEYVRPNDAPYTRGYSECGEEVSAQQIALMAMVHAVGRISRPSRIHIYTGCSEICRTDWFNRLHNWMENGFRTARGKRPVNYELWRMLGDVLDGHLISVEETEHEYRNWILTELERNGREGISHKSYDDIQQEDREDGELEKAMREGWSLDPDRRKWPRGLVRIGRKILNGTKYICYRDDNTEDAERRYRYDSEKCAASGEGRDRG